VPWQRTGPDPRGVPSYWSDATTIRPLMQPKINSKAVHGFDQTISPLDSQFSRSPRQRAIYRQQGRPRHSPETDFRAVPNEFGRFVIDCPASAAGRNRSCTVPGSRRRCPRFGAWPSLRLSLSAVAGVQPRVARTAGRGGLANATAGVCARPAAFGDNAGRAGAGQPFAHSWGGE